MGNSLNKLCHPRSDAYSSVQALQPVGRCGWGSATPAGWLYFRCQCGRCSISIHPNRLPTALRNIDSYPAFRRALKSHLFSCAFSLQLFTVIPYIHGHCNGCTDTSDLRHFGPKTFRHHVFGAEVSQIFAVVPKCLVDTSAPLLKCLKFFRWCRSVH